MNITIAMAQSFPDMPYWAAFPAMGPIPPGAASDPAKYKLHPWATGPYMFKPGSYTVGKKLTLIRNPNWDPNTDPARHAYIDEYDFNFDADSAQTDQILLQDQGDGQTTITYDNVLSADYGQFVQKAPDRLVKGPNPCTFMAFPDNRKITDINIRRAIGLAYPYKDAWAAGGSIAGVTRIPASNIMPPGVPGRTPYNPRPGVKPGDTDAAAAKALLKKTGNLGYKLEFAYLSDDPNSVAIKNVLVQAFNAAGFDAQPFASTSANYTTQVLQNPDWAGNVRGIGWCSDWPSGGSWFPPVFQGTDVDKTGNFGSNYAAFDKADSRILAIEKMPIDKQPAAWNALDKLIQTKWYPVVVTGYGADAMARGTKVMNMTNDPVYGMPNWKDMWLQP
jgi:peptide/nickel transport system substrate-binding protein